MLLQRALSAWGLGRTDPDHELVARAKAGDRVAFDRIMRQHNDALRGFVVLRVGQDAADDVLQECWTACWSSLHAFGNRSGFKTWLYGIAVNKCRDIQRIRGRSTADRLDDLDDVADQSDPFGKVDLREAVKCALETLPDAQREVVELYYYAELTLPEIAQSVQRNLNTVKYQFYRAHDQVARSLAESKA